MDVRLLWTVTLLLGLSTARKGGSVCIQAGARSCGECVQVSESCGWCSDEAFLSVGEAKSARCDDLQSLSERRCPPEKIENPRGSITIDKDQPVTNRKKDSPEKLKPEQITQIQPQKLSLTLRSGEPQTFSLKFKRAEDYPIDLYYLMDLSFSMKDDLENVKNLGTDLMREMQGITSDFRIGFGSIVKTPPPCPGTQSCPFSFTNVLSLTDRGDEFNRRVSEQQIQPELQSAPGGVQGVLQAALCQEQIGWREVTRLLVVSSDAEVVAHGGARRTLEAQCQMINHTYNDDGQAPASVSQLSSALSQHNIQTIFAVTEEVLPGYQELVSHIPKSTVGTLSSNSSNILELIVDAYHSLSSEVILENSRLPEGVSISYQSVCKNGVEGTGEGGRKCSNISIGDKVSFQISITAQKIPEPVRAEVIKIKPLGFNEEVEVVLNFIRECECSAHREPNSAKCSGGHGALECGDCGCNEGRVGRLCECSLDDVRTEDMDAPCRRDGGTDVCSNNGDCVCGTCECKKRENPEERYSGQYCECDNFNCDRSNNKLCGGHGRCECRVCICDANYTGSACDCLLDQTSCLAMNGQICNGRGTCECGVCKCTDRKFQGPTCEVCPTCPGVCTEHKDCVLCRAFGTGPKAATCERDCSYFTLTKVKETRDLPQPEDQSFALSHCRERDQNDCWFYFTYSVRRDHTKEVHVVETLDCPSTWFGF